ncbi:uncharacterized protein HaLaN_07248 [Haematococcus lacustris]|uniref:Uncharacterized protein n=1 Tax=Haematococcus lacustris TaxID=44745 RepID=A0A699YNK5_HAELA|nr:uncharacterized protein HaLaN_07248 [Haematococcus lacustris]
MSASLPMTSRGAATWGGRGHEGTGDQHPVQLGVLGPDPREEAVRRTQLRVEAYRQVKAETAAQAALADAARKQAAAEARQAVKAVKERKRAEIYAINAVLKL